MTYQNYPQQYAGLELLETPVMIVERNGQLLFANPACESLLKVGRKELQKHSLYALFHDARALKNAVQMALDHAGSYIEHDLELMPEGDIPLHIGLTVTPIDSPPRLALVEHQVVKRHHVGLVAFERAHGFSLPVDLHCGWRVAQRLATGDVGQACILKASARKSIARRTLGETNLRDGYTA